MPCTRGEQTERLIRVKGQPGRSILREVYLREDVPCHSALCLDRCAQWRMEGCSMLPTNVTHYVIPDCSITRHYMEVLELPQLTGLIFTQTVLNHVEQEGGRRLYRRLQSVLRDVTKHCVTFHNDFHTYTHCRRQPGEKMEDWMGRCVMKATELYVDHLAGQIPVIMLTSDKQISGCVSRTVGAHVMSLQDYLASFWPDLTEAADLCTSLTAALQEKSAHGSEEFTPYLPAEVVEAGITAGRYRRGRLKVNKHNAQKEAWVGMTGVGVKDIDGEKEVLVLGSVDRNRAVHGDTVAVEILPKSQWKARSTALHSNDVDEDEEEGGDGGKVPTGRVVAVLTRAWRDYVASFDPNQEVGGRRTGRVLVIPADWRIPKVRLMTSQLDTLRTQRIVVRIDSWDVSSQYPNGHFVRSLGEAGHLETETQCLLLEHNITVKSFSQAVRSELPSSDWSVCEVEASRRRDLRSSHLVFSIDPPGCEDVDDTLSIKALDGGGVELGVHIADVSHFVKPGSMTDAEARERSTTVYLADRRYDMLPDVLSANVCSLVSGRDRYAMSVMWCLDAQLEVVDVWYGRTVIRSSYKLYYEIVQQLYDGAGDDYLIDNIPELQHLPRDEQSTRLSELREAVSRLMSVTRHIHARRCQQGGLVLEGVEVAVQLDKTDQSVKDLTPKQPLEIHETIAECMIFANHWVAKKICQAFPSQALLRRHPLPRQEHFSQLLSCAGAHGYTIDTSGNKQLAASLDAASDPHDPIINKILRSLATQAMSNATYFSTGSVTRDNFSHYGLGLDLYTHFTSPIRRYADVLVHRQLLAAIDGDMNDKLPTNTVLQETAEHINIRHRAAQDSQKASVELFQTIFFRARSSDACCVVDAVVSQIRSNGLLVYVPRYGVKGAVFMRNKAGLVRFVTDMGQAEWTSGSLSGDSQTLTIKCADRSQTYSLMQHITVRILVEESAAHGARIKLELISAASSMTSYPGDAKGQKAHIIQEVTMTSEDKARSNIDLGADFEKLMSEYGQTEKSFYNVMLNLCDRAMLNL